MSEILPKTSIRTVITGRGRFVVAAATALFLIIGLYFGFFIINPAGSGEVIKVYDFARGSSLKKFAETLAADRTINSATLFTLYARLSGSASKVQAGSYQFSDAMPPSEILKKLVSGDIYERKFAMPEGYSIFQAAEMLESRGFFKKDEFLAACRDTALLRELGIKGETVEGYLYPSTYNLLKIEKPAELIRQMVAQFNKVYDEKFAEMEKGTKLTRSNIITLASMVEKEAVTPEEKPLIASVFFNRIKAGMPLQSDPTATYGLKVFGVKVSGEDVRRDSPYNTYVIAGLPPGPIGNPGSGAIEAVLKPATTGYYYFVAKKDGSHHFSKDLDEHNRAVRLYLKNGAGSSRQGG